MKKILFILILIILTFTFVGCAEVTYSVFISDGGARVYDYTVTLDRSDPNTPSNITLVKSFFEYLKSKNPYSDVLTDDENPNVVIYRISYESQTEYNLAMGITGDEPNLDSSVYTEKGFFRYYEGVLIDMDKEDFASYALMYLSFVDNALESKVRAELIAYSKNPTKSEGATNTVAGILVSEEDTITALRSDLSISPYANELGEITYEALKNIGYDYSGILATFEYSHVYKSIVGVNPDKVDKVKNELGSTQKVYSWKLDLFGHNEVKIYQRTPNVWVWEVIAIAFGILVAGIIVAVYFLKKKKFANALVNNTEGATTAGFGKSTSNANNVNNDFNSSAKATNNVNAKNEAMKPYVNWFGYSENSAKSQNNANASNKPKLDDDDDIFGEYLNIGAEENQNHDDSNEE